ncbi:GNAT family N-acetyltransferase [Paraurantiacibacter namhicola]|uniref:BioF2-like acetyltransferase domain-containing protein n=1 Tax=Paraurantiacibacter namhicola TaxID=645517 RepID=A0A1C7DA06_9SPHN|nr:GNAT family N-acetyltransferase [Paraurantiacibacter namhicola]ANU08143.1 hypothetical protein A6F65_01848 [Paraurantiacibacter namhicola]
MVEIRYHASVKALQASDFERAGPFGCVEWFAQLEDFGLKPLVAIAERPDGAAAAMVLERHGRSLKPARNWYAFTWDILRRGEHPPVTELAAAIAKQASRLDLDMLAEEDAILLRDAAMSAGFAVRLEPCDTNRTLAVAGRSYAEYHASLPGRLRTTLKRKAKKVEIRISERFDEAIWESYEDIYAESWKPEEGDPDFLRRFAHEQGDLIRLACAYAEGAPVAAQFWSVEGGVAYIHKLAHRESAKAISPGSSLTAALMEHVIDRDGVQLADFGTGDDPYKRDWMDGARTRFALTAWKRSDPRNWPAIARNSARNLVTRKHRR